MIVLAVTLHVKAGKENAVMEHFRTLEPESRKEQGCLMYVVHRGTTDTREFLVYEQYVDEAALEAHRQSTHFLEHAPKIYECCEAQQRALYRPLNESTRELLAD